jgi:hypothetical protein
MRPSALLAVFVFALLAAAVLFVPATLSFSDGTAGMSGAKPRHLQKCHEGFEYCKVTIGGCDVCHGTKEDMQHQRASEQPVIDRIDAGIHLAGVPPRDYEPGRKYVIDIFVDPGDREPGQYSTAAFVVNASAGTFSLFPNEQNLRITGGLYQHAGSKNPNAKICTVEGCRPRGAVLSDETNWTGELTNTGRGSSIQPGPDGRYTWRAYWTAPPVQEPHGVIFWMSYLVANGDGVETCTRVPCDGGERTDQIAWDWWWRLSPNLIVCEKGRDRGECEERVWAANVPPAPPLRTDGETSNGDVDERSGTPPPGLAYAILVVLAALLIQRRRKGST